MERRLSVFQNEPQHVSMRPLETSNTHAVHDEDSELYEASEILVHSIVKPEKGSVDDVKAGVAAQAC